LRFLGAVALLVLLDPALIFFAALLVFAFVLVTALLEAFLVEGVKPDLLRSVIIK
jgi:hypothetical protein